MGFPAVTVTAAFEGFAGTQAVLRLERGVAEPDGVAVCRTENGGIGGFGSRKSQV